MAASQASAQAQAQPINQTIVGNVLEVDHDETADSALGSASDTESYTTSLASSIMQYRQENGRTYHSYKDGKYLFPNDETENDRLDLQHHLFMLTLGGTLHLSPLKKDVHRVLDVGTGTGIWALDYADEHEGVEVIGTDLSPIQPSFVPPNLSFTIDDAEETWAFDKKFDFIHSRMLVGSFTNWPRYFSQAYENLTPGGWIEMQDVCYPLQSDDDSIPADSALKRWSALLVEASTSIGRPLTSPDLYPKQLEAAGFVNIQEVRYKWPVNTWPKGKKDKELGAWTLQNLLDGLQGFTLALLTRALGWSSDEVELFLVDVRKDAHNRRAHGYWPIYVTYAQKPESATSAPVAPVAPAAPAAPAAT